MTINKPDLDARTKLAKQIVISGQIFPLFTWPIFPSQLYSTQHVQMSGRTTDRDSGRARSAQSHPSSQPYSTPSQHFQMGRTDRDSGRGRSTQPRPSRRSLSSSSRSASRSPPPRASKNVDKRRAVDSQDEENSTPRYVIHSRFV